jgi:hypothetical protein
MFIIRNKETKKFPSEFRADIDFPLTTGEELHNKLSGCKYSLKKELLEQYLEEDQEIVEFKWCEPFYKRENTGGHRINICGYADIDFNTNLGTEYVYDDEDNNVMGTDDCAIEVPAYQKHFILKLYEGRAYLHYWTRHEEGSSYEELEVELVRDEEGFPYWSIDSDSGGTDCDGPIEYHRFFMSHGGFASKFDSNNQERYECELKWHSPMISDPQRKGWNRDVYAEQMGY